MTPTADTPADAIPDYPRIRTPFDIRDISGDNAEHRWTGDHPDQRGAVVAFSGGQDSTTCLVYALARYPRVQPVAFNYGQRHGVELDCAKRIVEVLRGARGASVLEHAEYGLGVPNGSMRLAPLVTISVPAFAQMADAALTNTKIPIEGKATDHEAGHHAGAASGYEPRNTYAADRGLPSTFVPGRNMIFLGLAAAYGMTRGADVLVTGVCETDEAGYPDCRREFVESFVDTVRIGYDIPSFQVDAPLLHRTKAQTWQLAEDLGAVDLVLRMSHTCYRGNHTRLNDWGYGCAECPACEARAAGWLEYVAAGVGRVG